MPGPALIAAIAAAPEDDEPRLVYADWLAQGGDPRGELIAVQCALARGKTPELEARQAELIAQHGAGWLAELGLGDGEGTLVRGFVERVKLPAARGPAAVERLVETPLRDLVVAVDLGGNDDELAAIAKLLQARLPPGLRRFEIDRYRHWDDSLRDDEIVVRREGRELGVQLGEPAQPRVVLAVLEAVLERYPDLAELEFELAYRGRVEVDDVIELLCRLGPRAAMRSLGFRCVDGSGRDWMRWMTSRRIADLIALYPALDKLSLPMAELWLDELRHATLRDLELHRLGYTPMGPTDIDRIGPPPRASGLEFLRRAQLPALERLAIDLQFDWYVPWQVDDMAALCEADLPRLRALELIYGNHGDELCRRLPAAPFAAQLEVVELTGCDLTDDGVQTLLAARGRFPRLRELITLQPHDVTDPRWRELKLAYPIVEPP